MPRTLEQAFVEFHARLRPRKGESQRVRRHREAIRACLVREFDLNSFSQCGSWGNGTSVAGHSDTDYLAALPAAAFVADSKKMLDGVRAALKTRFPQTKVRVNAPAVLVPFGSLASENTEIVVGKLCQRTANGRPIYQIADGAGGWMKTSPGAHNAHVAARDELLHARLKPLICFVKAWKYYNGVPVSSFYLEMRTALYMKGKAKVVFERDVAGLFALLDDNLADVRDPVKVAGLIKPCASPAQKRRTQTKVATAARRARSALAATQRGDEAEAFKLWRQLWPDKFPARG